MNGRFQPYGNRPTSRLQPLGPLRVQPYYQTATDAELIRDGMLPQLKRVYEAAIRSRAVAKLWNPLPNVAADMLKPSITRLLDNIGDLLCDGALVRRVPGIHPTTRKTALIDRRLPGSQALASPLEVGGDGAQVANTAGPCMLIDSDKVARTRHVRWKDEDREYMRVTLASVRPSSRARKTIGVHEYAYRIVLWAMHGPPPSDEVEGPIVAMHTCHNSRCINPNHLVWGNEYHNLGPHADAHAHEMMQLQLRTDAGLGQ